MKPVLIAAAVFAIAFSLRSTKDSDARPSVILLVCSLLALGALLSGCSGIGPISIARSELAARVTPAHAATPAEK